MMVLRAKFIIYIHALDLPSQFLLSSRDIAPSVEVTSLCIICIELETLPREFTIRNETPIFMKLEISNVLEKAH
jgi:hypothetical protein